MAQIEMGKKCVRRTSEPADAVSPASVSTSGRPAETNAPNAMTRISMVTGQDLSSELSMACRFASLKSDQRTGAPVGFT